MGCSGHNYKWFEEKRTFIRNHHGIWVLKDTRGLYYIYQRILNKSKSNHNKFELTQRLKQI